MNTKVKTITVQVSKKAPVPGEKYTTHSFSVGLEADIDPGTGCSVEDVDEYVEEEVARLKQDLQTKIDRWMEENGSADHPESDNPAPQSPLSPAEAKTLVKRTLEDLNPSDTFTKASDKQVKYLKGLFDQYDIDRGWVCDQCNADCLEDLLKEEAWEIIDKLADR